MRIDALPTETAKTRWKTNRTTGFLLIGFSYLAAIIVGIIVFKAGTHSAWFNLLLADIAATIVIWVFSLLLDNASVYDPYWSVQPVVILPMAAVWRGSYQLTSLILCSLVIIWGVRLTINWAKTFHNLQDQDWRYDLIKERTGKFYPLVNLLGIQLMPTLVVFACILPAVQAIMNKPPFTAWAIPGMSVCLLGIGLETIADHQMHIFRLQQPIRKSIIQTGLWKHSRHPNYLGEILMWWGIYLICVVSNPSGWFLALGAVLNTALFFFISIPMAEKRLAAYKDGFAEYKKRTRMLLPVGKVKN